MANKQLRIFHGFIVVAFAVIICIIIYGAQYSFGVFFEPLLEHFKWTRAVTSSIFSAYMIGQGFTFIVAGRLGYNR